MIAGAWSLRRRAFGAAFTAATLFAAVTTAPAASSAGMAPSNGGGTHAQEAGLVRDARCGHGFAIANIEGLSCTHGPDPSPGGSTGSGATTEELYAAATASTSTTTSGTTGAVGCYGDGTSGSRVQAVYARAADVADRYPDLAPLIAQWAEATDAVFADSAAKTGGIRHVRWVTDPSCALVVQRVQLSTTGDDNMSNTINELRALGLNRTDRKYLVWMDAAAFCGMSEIRNDDQAGSANANNYGPSIARVDNFCWGRTDPVEAHELMHTLGAVQDSAPHATGQAHCTDGEDLMCYTDSSGLPMTYVCPSSGRLLDCNSDDYFSTAPPAGTYLATHWNTAASGFLATSPPDATGGGTTSPPTPTPTTPLTATFTGSLTRKAPSATFPLTTGSGALTLKLQLAKRGTASLSIVAPDGSVLASTSGGPTVNLSRTVAAGSYRLVVSSSGGNTTFQLDATYPAP
jgi:hypothetical protein